MDLAKLVKEILALSIIAGSSSPSKAEEIQPYTSEQQTWTYAKGYENWKPGFDTEDKNPKAPEQALGEPDFHRTGYYSNPWRQVLSLGNGGQVTFKNFGCNTTKAGPDLLIHGISYVENVSVSITGINGKVVDFGEITREKGKPFKIDLDPYKHIYGGMVSKVTIKATGRPAHKITGKQGEDIDAVGLVACLNLSYNPRQKYFAQLQNNKQ